MQRRHTMNGSHGRLRTARRFRRCAHGYEALEARLLLYSQAAESPAHQWISQQGYLFLEDQFGESEITDFLGEVKAYPATDPNNVNALFIEGVFDEDEDLENPFGQGSVIPNTATLRHFWAHDDAFQREFDLGFQAGNDILLSDLFEDFWRSQTATGFIPFDFVDVAFESAANRGIKYFTGGFGLNDQQDGRVVIGNRIVANEPLPLFLGSWGDGNGATNNADIG